MIDVLLIEGTPSSGDAVSKPTWTEHPGLTGDIGETDLRFLRVRSLDEAAMHLQRARFDALLMDRGTLAEIGRLQAAAAETPILMITDEFSGDFVRRAIETGAQDVLLPHDLAEGSLERRIDLAIARKAVELQRVRHASKDVSTGLANRTLLEERFVRAIARSDRFATLVALVAIDLDGFEDIILRFGQSAADRLLRKAGQRLLSETRQTDTLARTRDHGFTWLVEGLAAIDDINALVDRLPKQLAHSFSIDDQQIRLTASVGVAICPFHGRDFASVHSMAEAAMLDVATISGDALLMLPIRSAALT